MKFLNLINGDDDDILSILSIKPEKFTHDSPWYVNSQSAIENWF